MKGVSFNWFSVVVAIRNYYADCSFVSIPQTLFEIYRLSYSGEPRKFGFRHALARATMLSIVLLLTSAEKDIFSLLIPEKDTYGSSSF